MSALLQPWSAAVLPLLASLLFFGWTTQAVLLLVTLLSFLLGRSTLGRPRPPLPSLPADSSSSAAAAAAAAVLWPAVLSPLLCSVAASKLARLLAALPGKPGWLRSLELTRLALASSPPALSHFRLEAQADPSELALVFRLDWRTCGTDTLELLAVVAPGALRLPLSVSRARVEGELRLSLGGLSPAFPWVSRARLAFTAPPELSFALGGALDHLPGLSGWLETAAANALRRVTEPAAAAVALSARLGDCAAKATLRVTVHSAQGLPPLPGYDPFARVALHGASFETGVRRRMVDPDWGGQAHDFTVWCLERARLRLDVLGWQPRGAPAALGGALLDLRCAMHNDGLAEDGTALPLTVRLSGGGTLRLTLQLWTLPATLPPGLPEWRPGDAAAAASGASSRSVDAATLPVRSQGEAAVPLSQVLAAAAAEAPAAEVPSSSAPSPPLPAAASQPAAPLPAPAPPLPAAPAGPLAELQVSIHSAHRLCSEHPCDPYIRLRLGRSMADSGVRRRLFDPSYGGQTLRLTLHSWRAADATLILAALGWLPDGVDPLLLGEGRLELRPLALAGRLPPPALPTPPGEPRATGHAVELALQPSGSVRISLALRPLACWTPPPEEDPADEGSAPPPPSPVLAALSSPSADGFINIELDTPSWLQPE
jgi:hypothetical protein